MSTANTTLPRISLEATTSYIYENTNSHGVTLVFTFTRTGDNYSPLYFSWALGGTAFPDIPPPFPNLLWDYQLYYRADGQEDVKIYLPEGFGPTRRLVFPPGRSRVSLVAVPARENRFEADETVEISLLPGNGYANEQIQTANGTIANDDTRFSLETGTSTASEADQSNLTFIFTREGPLHESINVYYQLGGSAILGTDYTIAGDSGTGSIGAYYVAMGYREVTFNTGEATTTISIIPVRDDLTEDGETVTANLVSGASSYPVVIYRDQCSWGHL